MDYHQKHQVQYQVLTVVSPNDTMHQQCSSLKKTLQSLFQLSALDLDNHHLVDCVVLQNSTSWFAWNAKVIDDFPVFLPAVLVIHQTPHSQGFELLLLP